jgi:WD40 repeat protein
MKIQGVNITGGIRLDPPVAPTPTGPSKFVVGARELGYPAKYGGIYVYNTDGTGEVKITASDGADNDRFGWSVAITDTKVVAGAVMDDDSGSMSGSVYVYNTDGTGEVKITASDAAAGDQFGTSVAMTSTKIVVGAVADDDAGSASGSVYVYNLDGTDEVKITASDAAAGDQFGTSVAMTSTKIVVGAVADDDAGSNSGSVYVYNLDGTGEVKITASDAATMDLFGFSVAVADNHIVVGAQGNDDSGSASGSAYVYNLDGTGEVKITASDAAADDRFGNSVAVSDTKVAVGAKNSGAVYVYNTDGTGEVKITASDGAVNDGFGCSVAIQGNKIIVGAEQKDSNQGAVYIYNTDGTGEQKILASDGASQERFGGAVAIN